MRTTLAGLALVTVLGMNARAQNADKAGDRDNGKRETVRGVVAGVTVAGETAIDFATQRALSAEMTYLTVVGSPVRDESGRGSRDNEADKSRDRENDGRTQRKSRHNVYVVWVTPKTEVRDATAHAGGGGADKANANDSNTRGNDSGARGTPASLDRLEVGDQVRVTFTRREFANSGGADRQKASRHGRHRTYFGDATSVVILAEPDHRASSANQDRDRDDDKDKVKDRGPTEKKDDKSKE